MDTWPWKTWHADGSQRRKPVRKGQKTWNSETVRTALTSQTLTSLLCASTRQWSKPVAFFTQGRRHPCQMDWHARPPGSTLMLSVIEWHWRRIGPTILANQSHVWSTREVTACSRSNSDIVPKVRSATLLLNISSQPFRRRGNGQPRAIASSQWMALRKRRKKRKEQTPKQGANWSACTWYFGTTSWCALWLFPNFNNLTSPSQIWMNGMIGSMGHPSQDADHHLRSSHSCGRRGMPGGKSTSSWQTVPPWRLRWRPSRKTNFSGPGRFMRGCSSNSWRHQEILKAKERVRTRGRKEARRVSTKTTWRPTPARVMARVTRPPKEVVPMDGLRTGHCRHPIGSNIAGTSTSNIPAKGTVADLMLALWGSMGGRATETTPLTNVQARGKLEPSWTPELIAGMIQRAGKRAPRMTSQSELRLMGQETWRTTLCQRPNHNFPIQSCGRHPRVRNPPILQKSQMTYQNPVGASLLWLPLWTLYNCKHFFHGPPLFQSGSNKGSFGTHQYHHMRCRNQASYYYILAKQTPKVLTPCFWAGSPVWRVTSLP